MDNSEQKKSLLWLEDEPKTVIKQLNFAKQRFYIETVAQLSTFAKFLNSLSSIKGIILDVMLGGINNLEPLQEGIDTNNGFETGWRVLEYLRSDNSKFKHIPVLILSVRDLTDKNKELLERLQSQPEAALITFIAKREVTRLGTSEDWNHQFKQWIQNLEKGK